MEATSTQKAVNAIKSWYQQRTFNPLAAGSIPARPTNFKHLRTQGKKPASTSVHILAGFLLILTLAATPAVAHADGWDFYFFGVNTKTFKEADWKMVVLGAATSLAVHTAGHYLYAAAADMHVDQDGFKEVISRVENSPREIREFCQAGFALQHAIGVALTTIPATRQTDFTKGYVVAAFAATALHPVLFYGDNDLSLSDQYGGNRDIEFIGYMAVATHNVLRVNWKKE